MRRIYIFRHYESAEIQWRWLHQLFSGQSENFYLHWSRKSAVRAGECIFTWFCQQTASQAEGFRVWPGKRGTAVCRTEKRCADSWWFHIGQTVFPAYWACLPAPVRKKSPRCKGNQSVTLLWTDGDAHIPCDCRIYSKTQDGKTKNDHFSDLFYKARIRGFEPYCVLFDSWYAGLDNLRIIRTYGGHWLTRFKPIRPVNPDGKGNVPLSSAAISETGTAVHLRVCKKITCTVFLSGNPKGFQNP